MFRQTFFNWQIPHTNLVFSESIESIVMNVMNRDTNEEFNYAAHDFMQDFFYIRLLRDIYDNEQDNDRTTSINNINKLYWFIDVFLQHVSIAYSDLYKEDDNQDKERRYMIYENMRKSLAPVLLSRSADGSLKLKEFRKSKKGRQLSKKQLGIKIKSIRKDVNNTFTLLFSYNLADLQREIVQLTNLLPKFQNTYIQKGKCFSMTEFKSENQQPSLLYALSGFKGNNDINKAISIIERNIPNCKVLAFAEEDINDVEYQTLAGRRVKYAKVKSDPDINKHKRMYSCCERKTFTYMRKQNEIKKIDSYQMYVKFQPCDLCAPFVNESFNLWKGVVKTGKNGDNRIFDINNPCADSRKSYEDFAAKYV